MARPGKPELDMQEYMQAYKARYREDADEAVFGEMLERLRAWRERYYTAIVPQHVSSSHPQRK